MLCNSKASAVAMRQHTAQKSVPARTMVPAVVRLGPVHRSVATRALLLPQQQGKQTDTLDAIISAVLSWLEPKEDNLSSMEESLPELGLLDDDEGHTGWGHSHIADRLATESSMSQEFDL